MQGHKTTRTLTKNNSV
jgi:hypothetical protein